MSSITITDVYHNLLRDATKGLDVPTITYVAIGTGSTTPSHLDTKLVAEVYRKKISSLVNGASVGEVLLNGYLNANEAVGVVIAEVGYFAGKSASATANSGVLVGRVLYSHTKGSTEGLQLQDDATF